MPIARSRVNGIRGAPPAVTLGRGPKAGGPHGRGPRCGSSRPGAGRLRLPLAGELAEVAITSSWRRRACSLRSASSALPARGLLGGGPRAILGSVAGPHLTIVEVLGVPPTWLGADDHLRRSSTRSGLLGVPPHGPPGSPQGPSVPLQCPSWLSRVPPHGRPVPPQALRGPHSGPSSTPVRPPQGSPGSPLRALQSHSGPPLRAHTQGPHSGPQPGRRPRSHPPTC